MKCLVLGGSGFLGSHLVDGLLDAGHDVRVFDRAPAVIRAPSPRANFEFVEGDFLHPTALAAALEGCATCFHLVTSTGPRSSNANPASDIEENLVGTLRFLELARKAGVRKIIFSSSGGTVYGTPTLFPISETHPTDPLCSYGIAKLAIEKYLALFHRLYGLDYTILRIANPYGARARINGTMGVIETFAWQALNGDPIDVWGDGTVVRDFVYVTDVVAALLAAMTPHTNGQIFNIGSGAGLSLNELIARLENAVGRPISRHHRPARAFDTPANILDIQRATRVMEWHPKIALDDGIGRVIAAFEKLRATAPT